MIPVVVDHALEEVAEGALAGLAVFADEGLLQDVAGQRVEPGIGRCGDFLPGGEHFTEGGRAGRPTAAELCFDVGERPLALAIVEEVALLLPGEVADVPTYAVHGRELATAVVVADALDRPSKFAAGEAELCDKWVGHGYYRIGNMAFSSMVSTSA